MYNTSRFKAAETYEELFKQIDTVIREFDVTEGWAVGDVSRYDYEYDFEDRKLLYGAVCEALTNSIHRQCASDRFAKLECRHSSVLQKNWESAKYLPDIGADKLLPYWEHRIIKDNVIAGEIAVYNRRRLCFDSDDGFFVVGIFEVNFKENVTGVRMFYEKFCEPVILSWFDNGKH